MIKSLLILFVLLTPGTAENKIRITVLDLKGNNLSEGELGSLSNRLRSELSLTGKFMVFERGRTDTVMNVQRKKLSTCASQECRAEAARELGITHMVSGTLDRVEEMFSADIRLINTESGEVEKSAVEDCDSCGLTDVMKVILKSVAGKLAGEDTSEKAGEAGKKTTGKDTSTKLTVIHQGRNLLECKKRKNVNHPYEYYPTGIQVFIDDKPKFSQTFTSWASSLTAVRNVEEKVVLGETELSAGTYEIKFTGGCLENTRETKMAVKKIRISSGQKKTVKIKGKMGVIRSKWIVSEE